LNKIQGYMLALVRWMY